MRRIWPLRLRQQKELREAKQAGADLAALQEKHRLEQRLLGLGDVAQSMSRVAGTFSASAVAGLGSGSVQERIARAVEKQIPKQQDMIGWLTKMFGELKRFNLEASP